jgi:hypothetical protein
MLPHASPDQRVDLTVARRGLDLGRGKLPAMPLPSRPSLFLALTALAACGSPQPPAPAPAPIGTTTAAAAAAEAAPPSEQDPRETECQARLERFGDGASPAAIAYCVAGFGDSEQLATCHAAGMLADYVACYPGCLASIGIEPDPAVPVDDLWTQAVDNCVFGCASTVCGEPE